jgi:YgiT-type zinc finger domain-containing protein
MKSDQMRKSWSGLSEEILSGMAEWREQHPKATFRQIEAEVDQRLSVLRARMLADAAVLSGQTEWEGEAVCPECGAALKRDGKKKRTLETRGGQQVELEREYGVCPQCGAGIFPPG